MLLVYMLSKDTSKTCIACDKIRWRETARDCVVHVPLPPVTVSTALSSSITGPCVIHHTANILAACNRAFTAVCALASSLNFRKFLSSLATKAPYGAETRLFPRYREPRSVHRAQRSRQGAL